MHIKLWMNAHSAFKPWWMYAECAFMSASCAFIHYECLMWMNTHQAVNECTFSIQAMMNEHMMCIHDKWMLNVGCAPKLCVLMCACVDVCVCVCVHTFTNVFARVSLDDWAHNLTWCAKLVCVDVCMQMRSCVCRCICVYICIYV